MDIIFYNAIGKYGLLTLNYAAEVLSVLVLFFEWTITGADTPFAAPESIITSSMLSWLGRSNIVFNSIFSRIDLSPLAPVFLDIAISKKTGARGLRSILENILLKTMFDLPSQDNIEEVIIDSGAAKGVSAPVIVHSKNKTKTDKTSAA